MSETRNKLVFIKKFFLHSTMRLKSNLYKKNYFVLLIVTYRRKKSAMIKINITPLNYQISWVIIKNYSYFIIFRTQIIKWKTSGPTKLVTIRIFINIYYTVRFIFYCLNLSYNFYH